jgi:hypothetical protein
VSKLRTLLTATAFLAAFLGAWGTAHASTDDFTPTEYLAMWGTKLMVYHETCNGNVPSSTLRWITATAEKYGINQDAKQKTTVQLAIDYGHYGKDTFCSLLSKDIDVIVKAVAQLNK